MTITATRTILGATIELDATHLTAGRPFTSIEMWLDGEMLTATPTGHLTEAQVNQRLSDIETYALRYSDLTRGLEKCGWL